MDNLERIEQALSLFKLNENQMRRCRREMREARYLVTWNSEMATCLSTCPLHAASYAQHNYLDASELNTLVHYHVEQALGTKIPHLHPESFLW
jgi:hypothetical protein